VPNSHLADEISQSLVSARNIAGPFTRVATPVPGAEIDPSDTEPLPPLYIPDLQYVEDLFRSDVGEVVSSVDGRADSSLNCLSMSIWKRSSLKQLY